MIQLLICLIAQQEQCDMTDHKKHPHKDKHCEDPDFTTQDDEANAAPGDGDSGGGGTKNPPPPGK